MRTLYYFVFLLALSSCNASSSEEMNISAPEIEGSSINEKVTLLISKMTIDEKLGQMAQAFEGTYASESEAKEAVRAGKVGSFLNVFGAEKVNAMQKIAVEESRLGIPLIIGRDVIHGYKTIFPIPLGMASSWNPEAAKQAMRVAAAEASSQGINWTFAPMIDVTWDPRWGRIAESCGEDPFLASVFGKAMINGIQGDDPSDPSTLAACAKHFVGYGMAEAGRDYNTTYIPEPLLRNVHLKPFKAAVEADALTFMSAFNDLNGVPTSGNVFTLRQILREEWGYKGFVVSDWDSVEEMIDHGFAADEKDAGMKGLTAGVDMEMASKTYRYLKELVKEGKVSEKLINEAVANILRVKFRLGLFEHPYVEVKEKQDVFLKDEYLHLARKVASESSVLLKNDNAVLPLSEKQTIAMIGPLADSPRDQLGTWVFDGDEKDSQTPKMAFEAALGANLLYTSGLEYSRDKSEKGFAKAIEIAKKADVVVFFAGEEAALSGEANARGKLHLPGKQHELIAKLKSLGKPIVMVVMAGRPLAINEEINNLDAILYAWHGGTMAGPAIFDVLYGKYNPSGKLPVTFVKGAGQIPFYYYRKNTGRPGTKASYTHIDKIPRNSKQLSLGFESFHLDYGFTPLLPFGFGLSYTKFQYSDLKLSSEEMLKTGNITVTAKIKNIGKREGEEVVQLYVRDHVGSITRPIKELKGFKKILLKVGEEKEVSFELKAKDLEFHNGTDYVIEPGKFTVWIAAHSDDNSLHADFKIK